MRNVSDKSCSENQNTFVFNYTFPANRAVYEIIRQATNDNTAYAHCMLNKATDIHS